MKKTANKHHIELHKIMDSVGTNNHSFNFATGMSYFITLCVYVAASAASALFA